MDTHRTLTLVVFVLVYAGLILFKRRRTEILSAGVLVILASGVLAPAVAVRAVSWNVIGIFAGVLLLAEMFTESGMPLRIADILIDRSKNVGRAILLVCVFAGFVSIFVENVATVLIVAPVAIQIARRVGASPVPFLVGIAVSSNLQGAGTLIGDPPSMILAAFLKMDFNDFFWMDGHLSIFWAVQAGAVAGTAVLWLLFRRFRNPVEYIDPPQVSTRTPSWAMGVLIVLLALSPKFDPGFRWLGGTLCVGTALLVLLREEVRSRGTARRVLGGFDWNTTVFLIGVFILVEALVETGLVRDFAGLFLRVVGSDPMGIYASLVSVSVVFSALVDNIPYITAMIPVVQEVAASASISSATPLVFGMLLGASLGGNITPFGASANVVAVGLLRKEGSPVSTWEFLKIGLPFTLAATLAGAVFLAWAWNLG